MRSVFVFPRLDRAGVVAVLDGLSPGQSEPWLVDEVLYVGLVTEDDSLYQDWEPETVERLTATVGHRPAWAVVIDISGRVDGTEELCRLVLNLIDAGGGAIDDYSDHVWTGNDIRSGTRYDGLSFFDFRGSHDRHR